MKSILKKTLIFSVLFGFLAFFLAAQIVWAQTGVDTVKEGLNTAAGVAGVSGGETDLAIIAGKLINYLFGIVAVIFLTITLVGGYLWLTAGGNEENVKKAKSFIINGINGMIVIFLAYALVYVMLYALKQSIGA